MSVQPRKPHRVRELWFEDGNVVIQAGSSQFRLYRGILAARSPVFQDMFSFPQPPDSELVDECPVVHIPDAATEVTHFLKAIFVPEYFPSFPALTTFDIIVGCLRLSHKYQVDYLRRRALVHFSSRYRTTLLEWDSSGYEDKRRPASKTVSWPTPLDQAFEIRVIQIAREVDAPWVLPTAFYRLSSTFKILGTDIFHGTIYDDVPIALCIQDQKSFIKGHDIQAQSTSADIMQFLCHPPLHVPGCASPMRCALERLQIIKNSRWLARARASIPLDAWDDWDVLRNVCQTCLLLLQRTHTEARQLFWDQLPKMYGLPVWEELEKMKAAAIGDAFL
ncbi:hypothetical protein FB451DRAFT_1079609 [Mycena latifolia]|nr:hypothetical protein FB451DRAFT_1079609 [Mycena latifolia]